MAKLKDLKDLVQNVNLTEEQIAELLAIIIDMKKKNEDNEKGRVVLSPELVALLEKCTMNRGEELVCPLCGSTSVNKNGKKDGRQRYICKSCIKTFGDTYGTLLYHSRLTIKQWIDFLTLTLYQASLNRIATDIKIHVSTVWYNRNKICSLIKQLDGEQDSFPSIVEGDEFFIPLSFIGEILLLIV